MNLFLFLLAWDQSIYLRWEQVSSFSFEVVNVGESFLEFGVFVVIDFAFGELKMLLQYLNC